MANLRSEDLAAVALRASLLQATWNYERQQGLGWSYSLQPVIERLYQDPETRGERLAEHSAYFNTQPTLASVALGAIAGLEEQRAAGIPVENDVLRRVKGVLGSALAALGDRLFWFTLRPWAACLGVTVAMVAGGWGALVMWACYNAVHLSLRWRGVRWGYDLGPAILTHGLRRRLDGLIDRLGGTGAALTGVLTALLLVPGGAARSLTFQVLLVAGLTIGLLVTLRARPTVTLWALGFGILSLIAGWTR